MVEIATPTYTPTELIMKDAFVQYSRPDEILCTLCDHFIAVWHNVFGGLRVVHYQTIWGYDE